MAVNLSVSSTINEALAPIQSSSHNFKNHLQSFQHSKYSLLHASANSNISSSSICIGNLATGPDKRKSGRFSVRASSEFFAENPIAPVRLETEAGKTLIKFLEKNPAAYPSGFHRQRLLLMALMKKLSGPSEPSDLTEPEPLDEIFKKEAEAIQVTKEDCLKIMTEIMYCRIVDKFLDNGISMIPPIKPPSPYRFSRRVDLWPNQQEKYTSIHSYCEVLEMIQSHLIHEFKTKPEETTMLPVLETTRKQLGAWYASSIAFGYHLERIDRRYRLNNILVPFGEDFGINLTRSEIQRKVKKVPDPLLQIPEGSDEATVRGPNKLRAYIYYFEDVHKRRLERIRSSQARSLIHMQTQAVFNRPDFQDFEFQLPDDETIELSDPGMTTLILEAVAFGLYLYETETYFDFNCHMIVFDDLSN